MSWVLKQAFPVNTFSAFCIHGKNLFLANEDFAIRQWSLKTQSVLFTYEAHVGKITDVCYIDDLGLLLSTSADGRLIVWFGRKILATFLNRERKTDSFGVPLFSVCYSPKNKAIFVGSKAEVIVFDINSDYISKTSDINSGLSPGQYSTLSPSARFKLHTDNITKMRIIDDRICTISADHTIGLTRLDSYGINKIVALSARRAITSFAYCSRQQIIFVGTIDGKVYTISKDGLIHDKYNVFGECSVAALEVDKKSKLVWAISQNGEIKLLQESNLNNDLTSCFDTLRENPLVGISKPLYFNVTYDHVSQMMFVFLNSHYLLAYEFDAAASYLSFKLDSTAHCVYSVNFIPPIKDIETHPNNPRLTARDGLNQGCYIFTGGKKHFTILKQENEYKFIKINEVITGTNVITVDMSNYFICFGDGVGNVFAIKTMTLEVAKLLKPVNGSITSIHVFDLFIIATTVNGSWHMISLANFPDPPEEKSSRPMAHNGAINDSVYDETTGSLITAGSDGLVKCWVIQNNHMKNSGSSSFFLTASTPPMSETSVGDMREYGEVLHIRLSNDHKRIVTSHSDKYIRVWGTDLVELNMYISISCNGCSISYLVLDDRYVFSALDDRTIRQFDFVEGKIKRTFIGHKDTITAIGIGRDVPYYVSSSWDGIIKLWTREEKVLEPIVFEDAYALSNKVPELRRDKIMRPFAVLTKTSVASWVERPSLYDKRKLEMERNKQREKEEYEANQKTQIAKDLRALTKLIWERV